MLVSVVWHPARWWEWFMPEDEEKGTEQIFTIQLRRYESDKSYWKR